MSTRAHRRLVGQRVRAYREEAEWTQKGLAQRADLSTVFISQVERGVANASLDTLVRIANALHVRPRQLVRDI